MHNKSLLTFETEQTGEITIDLKSNNKNHFLILTDNGKRLPKDLNIDNLDSFGLRNMKLLAK